MRKTGIFGYALFVTTIVSAVPSTISGTVVDAQGGPLAGVVITIVPSRTAPVKTAYDGSFTLSNVPCGMYSLNAVKTGYIAAGIAGVAVPSTVPLHVAMTAMTLSTLQQIATVHTTANSLFNTTTSALANLDQQVLVDQGQLNIGHVLDQIPGVVSARPGTANAAIPAPLANGDVSWRGQVPYGPPTFRLIFSKDL